MPPGNFPAYLESAIHGYARENVESGRWPEIAAVERSREAFHSLLPQGIATPDNYFFEIAESADSPAIGFVWYAVQHRHDTCEGFIYDLEILEPHRRRGHAGRALQAVEKHACEQGVRALGLNVFATNHQAQRLYARLGYATTNLNMRKPLAGGRKPVC